MAFNDWLSSCAEGTRSSDAAGTRLSDNIKEFLILCVTNLKPEDVIKLSERDFKRYATYSGLLLRYQLTPKKKAVKK